MQPEGAGPAPVARWLSSARPGIVVAYGSVVPDRRASTTRTFERLPEVTRLAPVAPFLWALVTALSITAAARVAAAVPAPSACGDPATRVHVIQGSGGSSPLLGREDVVVDAVVVGVFPGLPRGLGGLFVQEEDVDADADAATSEGLFVFDGGLGAELRLGDRVRVRGRVSEFFGLTELSEVREILLCPWRGGASASRIRLPLVDRGDLERWEGMRVRLEQTLVASGHRNLGRFGEIDLSADERLWQATHRQAPGAPALALHARDERRRILLDDGSHALDPEPTPYLDRDDGSTLRTGDRLTRLDGVLDFAFGRFRIHPTGPVRFEPGEPRPLKPPAVDGTLRFVAWNVGNHFNGDGDGAGFPTRGPRTARELERQRAKLVATLLQLRPDVAALSELENDGVASESALGQWVDALNRETSGPTYAPVDPGGPRLGRHPIAVAILYRTSAVTPIGPPAILDARAHQGFDDSRNRPSLAQSFEARATGERFTVVANHFKSKGSTCDAVGDPDIGDGQGECSATRRRAAHALVEWLASDPTGAGDAPILVAGDLNAYPREDPVHAIVSAGYVDLLGWFAGPDGHTFVFDGKAGRLDHALARTDLLPHVGGAGVWHTNADEPRILDYRASNPPERYAPDPFRASDHDPVLVGLFPDTDVDGVTDHRDSCPGSSPSATVILGGCDSGAPERTDEAGCNTSDRLLALYATRRHPGLWVREASRLLEERIERGWLARRDRGAILACAARLLLWTRSPE